MIKNHDYKHDSSSRMFFTNKSLFFILGLFLVVALMCNLMFKTFAYFSDSTSSSSIVTTGNVQLTTHLYDSTNTEEIVDKTITSIPLIPGNSTLNYLRATNTGTTDCYIRLTCQVQLKYSDQSSYQYVDSLISLRISDNANYVANSEDGCIYYKQSLVVSGQINIPLEIVVNDDLGADPSIFEGASYKVTVIIQALQTLAVTLDSTNGGWTDSRGNEISL